ncbi:hypothetical protein BCR42DRAFT_128167 [Absidia repens]|uniref:Uncharacterized protein n=1 Tax=Absidia repens TaxID=90262 RepID=A0A1X2IVH5_9FUNG|nr:hypothetical protein BCR42DRAFT_128167 [Absidia repens]
MSRRFSTMEYSTNDQNDMANDVRLKLAKIRATRRSICVAPPPLLPTTPSSSTGSEIKKSKRSSQIPRSSITAMTTSTKAKVRPPYTNDCPTKNNNNIHKANNLPSSPLPTNTPEPNSNRRHSVANSQQRTKPGTTTRWNEDDTLIKFFDSDSDEDELFFRNNSRMKSSPRLNRHHDHSKPRTATVTSNLLPAHNADENHVQSLRAELQELKARVAKLEGGRAQQAASTPISKPATCDTSRRSALNDFLVLSPQISLVDSACSVYNANQIPSHSQKVLQDTVLHLEHHLRQDDHSIHSNSSSNNTNTTFMDTLVALVAETMTINQTLATSDSRHQVASDDLLALQKSSNHQINLLTETLQSLTTWQQQQQQQQHFQQRQRQQQQQQQQQQQSMDPPVSPPLSPSGSINNDIGANSPKPSKHHVAFRATTASQQKQPTSNHSHHFYSPDICNDRDTNQHCDLPSSTTDQKPKSCNSTGHIIKFNNHKVTPTKQQHPKSVNGILYYPHQHQQRQQQQHNSSTSTMKQQSKSSIQQQAFQPMSTSRVNQLLSKYDTLLKKSKTPATTHQHRGDRDRFSSFIDY